MILAWLSRFKKMLDVLLFTPSCIETTSERSNSYTPQMSYIFLYNDRFIWLGYSGN